MSKGDTPPYDPPFFVFVPLFTIKLYCIIYPKIWGHRGSIPLHKIEQKVFIYLRNNKNNKNNGRN